MDYGRLNRKELQLLCKEHGIPANQTNVCMAEALGARLNKPKDSQQLLQSVPDIAEIVKEKAERTTRSRRGTHALEAGEVDDLSSQLALSKLAADDSELGHHADTEPEGLPQYIGFRRAMQVSRRVPVDSTVEDPSELRQESEIVIEAAKVPRRTRKKTSKANVSINSRRAPHVKEHDSTEAAGPELPSASIASVPTYMEYVEGILLGAESHSDSLAFMLSYEAYMASICASSEGENFIEESTVAAKTVTKKSRAKGKRSKKEKPVPPISILKDQAIVNTATIAAAEVRKTEVVTTPMKYGDGKENSFLSN